MSEDTRWWEVAIEVSGYEYRYASIGAHTEYGAAQHAMTLFQADAHDPELWRARAVKGTGGKAKTWTHDSKPDLIVSVKRIKLVDTAE